MPSTADTVKGLGILALALILLTIQVFVAAPGQSNEDRFEMVGSALGIAAAWLVAIGTFVDAKTAPGRLAGVGAVLAVAGTCPIAGPLMFQGPIETDVLLAVTVIGTVVLGVVVITVPEVLERALNYLFTKPNDPPGGS